MGKEMLNAGITNSESATSKKPDGKESRLPTWLKMGAVAAASALAGGLAAAWFYRGTLKRLRSPELQTKDSNFGIRPDNKDEDC